MNKNRLTFFLFLFLFACSKENITYYRLPDSDKYRNRGFELMQGLAACGFCHSINPKPGESLTGGRVFYDRYGAVTATNLTPDETGLGNWNINQVLQALRSSIGKDEAELSIDAHEGFYWLSDADALSIASYLATLSPEKNIIKKREVSFTDSFTKGWFERKHREVRGMVPEINTNKTIEYGKYLFDHVSRCGACHTNKPDLLTSEKYLEGAIVKFKEGEKFAPPLVNFINSASSWSKKDLLKYLVTGEKPNGDLVDSNFCPVEFYANAREQDLQAIVAYLRSLSN